jgi:hypothetical protein
VSWRRTKRERWTRILAIGHGIRLCRPLPRWWMWSALLGFAVRVVSIWGWDAARDWII